jgi:hypothetical protein
LSFPILIILFCFTQKKASPLTVRLSQRTISYTIDDSELPQNLDIMAAVNITSDYLTSYFLNIYSDMESFTVSMNTSRFNLTGPFEIDYDSIATFPSVMTRRTLDQLDQSFQDAFSPPQGMEYLTKLQELPDTNIFSTVTDVQVSIPSSVRLNIYINSHKSVTGKKTAFLSAMGASAFVVVLAGIVCFQKRSTKPIIFREILSSKNFTRDQPMLTGGKNHKSTKSPPRSATYYSRLYTNRRKIGSHFTVAGDTYTGDGTVWSGTYTNETQSNDEVIEFQQQQLRTVVLVDENPYLEDDDNSSIGGASLFTTAFDKATQDSQPREVHSIIGTTGEVVVDVLQAQTLIDDGNDNLNNTIKDDEDDDTKTTEDGLLQPGAIYENDDDNDIQETDKRSSPQQGSFWNKGTFPTQTFPLLSPRKYDQLDCTSNCTTPSRQEQGSYWKKDQMTGRYVHLPSPSNLSGSNGHVQPEENTARFKFDDTISNDGSLDVPSLVGKDDRTSIFATPTEDYRPAKVSDLVRRFTANRKN